ncbi:hypothetical protein [Rhodanobacter thiooxydans]|uniref:hypothetical protein n=1 Tax=Rhodanobacter thiooxydans TaxID=416169 RepID=UPI001F1F69D1|nr:hypothetical protein [Rhodanobacter thiooxydans]UJJ56787.1 hypothetical protein LRK53_18400 [Rhodanobacter thiooxydans]
MTLTQLLVATRKGVLAMLEQDRRYGNAPLLLPRSSRAVTPRDGRLAPDAGLTTADVGIDTQRAYRQPFNQLALKAARHSK